MPRLIVRRADRRLHLYTGRLMSARTERAWLFAVVGWLLGEYHAADVDRRQHWKTRLRKLAEEMNEEARR